MDLTRGRSAGAIVALPVLLLLLTTGVARSEPGLSIPYDAFSVGLVEAGTSIAAHQLTTLTLAELRSYGFQVEIFLAAGNDPRGLLDSHPELDYVVQLLDRETAGGRPIANVFVRSQSGAPLRNAADDLALASAVARFVADEGRLSVLVRQKRERALAVLQDDPGHFRSLMLLGTVHYAEGNLDAAVETLEAALRTGRGDAEAHFNLYLAYQERGNQARAGEHLEAVFRTDPGHEKARIAKANRHFASGEYARAIPIYLSLLGSPTNGSLARYNLGLSYLRTNSPERADSVFRTIPEWDPLFAVAWNEMELLRQQADTRAAGTAVREARRSEVRTYLPVALIGLFLVPAVVVSTRLYREISSGTSPRELRMQFALALLSATVAVVTTLITVFFR